MRKLFLPFLLALGLAARAAEIKITFSDLPAGSTPTNFIAALAGGGLPGDWKIVSDEVPAAFSQPLMPGLAPTPMPAKRGVLAQLSGDATDEHFPMLIYNGATFKNFHVDTSFKMVGGAMEQMAGLVFRWQNASNFYVVRASALGRNLRFYKVVNGVRGNFIGPDMEIATNVWHSLSVQCDGDQITIWFDGRLATAPMQDTSFDSGRIGFWTKSDAVSYFSDTVIHYTPIIPAAQQLVDAILQKYPRILGLRIYAPDKNGDLKIIAGNVKSEIGQPGTDAEKKCYEKGALFYGHGKGTVAVDYPLNDRNGDPIAAVRVQLKSYSLAETRDMVVDRVRIIINEMQKRVIRKEDLLQ